MHQNAFVLMCKQATYTVGCCDTTQPEKILVTLGQFAERTEYVHSFVALLQAAKSVSDGYHRNLSTALADMYQTHVGSFLAGIIYRLCGNNLDLITLMHAHQDWTASRRADDSFLQSILQFCETRTVAELPALMNQVNVISVLEGADYSSFRPAHEFPLFAQVYASLNNVKVGAL